MFVHLDDLAGMDDLDVRRSGPAIAATRSRSPTRITVSSG
jgi:hypothetical protein